MQGERRASDGRVNKRARGEKNENIRKTNGLDT